MIKKLFLGIVFFAVMTAGAVTYVWQQVDAYLNQPLQLSEPELITIKSGTSFPKILVRFSEKGWVNASEYARFVSRVKPELTGVKAGTFQIQPGMTLADALQFLTRGKEHQFSITFVEGSRFSDWRTILNDAEMLEHRINQLSEKEIAQRLGIEQDKLEGLFLAETYHYTAGMTDLQLLKRANQNLTRILDAHWDERQEDLPIKTAYEALILASIIEKETALDSEREKVASVFVNRLKRNMRLQTDPTVIYGMGDAYAGNIRKKDLQTRTPYNTYMINGLPPTPIAMAGKASIIAALHPEKSRYLYFVASGKGGHVFTNTLTEHNRAVRDYLKELRKNK
ncbi:endolytic transglycosylase MltG [Vibrio sp. HA2012]|uniref:endolytic transglycosylase MltG n=1 Tax=Vibrio sp. HA2012 TaxID=1971595 RepID=UPI000C2C8705|nr:endolytic transglycosylase MltG [Vibrio sp. HA2012]PJC88161.1 endolytic transglycosylase MltG [Vibrio sp. HA2012]